MFATVIPSPTSNPLNIENSGTVLDQYNAKIETVVQVKGIGNGVRLLLLLPCQIQ